LQRLELLAGNVGGDRARQNSADCSEPVCQGTTIFSLKDSKTQEKSDGRGEARYVARRRKILVRSIGELHRRAGRIKPCPPVQYAIGARTSVLRRSEYLTTSVTAWETLGPVRLPFAS